MNTLVRFCAAVQVYTCVLLRDENGQDLVEYALVVALIALGATASMSALALSFSTVFSNVGNKVATYTS
jgi:pilus assembly protein Flp/PilA